MPAAPEAAPGTAAASSAAPAGDKQQKTAPDKS
jgi:hypothetical protein